jgi:hypothetical protein
MNFLPRPVFVLLFASCLFFCLSLSPRPAHANGIPIIGLDVGWEDMLIGGHDYKTNNHGIMFTLAVGGDAEGGSDFPVSYIWGFQLEQDLGFIDLRLRDNGSNLSALSNELRFKGATLVSANLHRRLFDGKAYISPKIGVGSVYMKAPKAADKSVQAWFALRQSVGINFIIDVVMVGLEFDYTLGLSSPNVFDHSRVTHFVSLKLKIQFNSNI